VTHLTSGHLLLQAHLQVRFGSHTIADEDSVLWDVTPFLLISKELPTVGRSIVPSSLGQSNPRLLVPKTS